MLRGHLLVEAESWLDKQSKAISFVEREFIQKSKQRERFNRYRLAAFVSIFSALSIFAQQQFAESQFREDYSAVLIGGSSNPELIYVLPKALQIADRQVKNNDIISAVASYKAVLKATQKFKDAALKRENKFSEKDSREIAKSQFSAEDLLSNLIEEQFLHQLRDQLNAQKFGSQRKNEKTGIPITAFGERYEIGALRTTYEILMRRPGLEADLNENGLLDPTEKIYLPCKTLRRIERMWRHATGWRCGFYDQNNKSNSEEKYYTAQSCIELSQMTLTEQVFPRPIDSAIEQIKNCKIEDLIHEAH